MRRRTFVAAIGTGLAASLAGCLGDCGTTTGEESTLVVGTYSAFLDAPSISPGEWLKGEFESEFDATLVWQSPPNEINHYIERRNADVGIDADVYVGLNVDELVRVDESLFAAAGDITGLDSVKPGLEFDPDGRAIPYDTGYVCSVYDGTAITVHRFGADGYLDYWADLQDNDVRVLGSWSDAYGAWQEGEAPMVISFSTDQVFADREEADLAEHQIRFLDDQGDANPEGMVVFDGASEADLAREFMGFLLRPEIQGEIAKRNVQFLATDNADLAEDYDELAHEPPEPVTFAYEERHRDA